MSETKFKVGDSIVVKPSVIYPFMGSISGWQGRISEIHSPDDNTVDVEWDSITLINMPESVIVYLETKGFYLANMRLLVDEVVPAEVRDSYSDVKRAIEKISNQYGWLSMGNDEAQGRRIQAVVNSADSMDEMDVFETWDSHLEANMKLPFKAEVYESQERGPIRSGDKVTVLAFDDIEEMYGILVKIKHKRGNYFFPLCDLIPLDEKSENYLLSDAYNVWFANRG